MSAPTKPSGGWSAKELGIEVDEEDFPMTEYWKKPDYDAEARNAWMPQPPPALLGRALTWLYERKPGTAHYPFDVSHALRTLKGLPEWPRTCSLDERRSKMHRSFIEPAEAFDPEATGNLLFAGPTGVGKTLAAVHAVLSLWQRRLGNVQHLPKVMF